MQKGTSYPDNPYCSFLHCGSFTVVGMPVGQGRDDLYAWYMETALPTEHFPGSHTCSFPLLFICFSLVLGLSPREWFAFSLHETWSTIDSGREGLYFSHIFGLVEFLILFSTSFPRKPCASLAVVPVALLWPGARDFLSSDLAVGFLKDGIIPALCLQTWGVLGAPGARGFSRSVGSWGVWWLLKSFFPQLVSVRQLQPILAELWVGALPFCLCGPSYLPRVLHEFVPMAFISIVPFPVLSTVWFCQTFFLSLLMRRKIAVTFPARINTLRWKWMRREHGKRVVPTV